jgi:glycosyltransferase involved in cell wall biosynthesis
MLSTFYPYRGGIAQFNAAMYRALERQGHELAAFTFTRQYPEFLFPGKSQLVGEGDGADPIPAMRILDSINPLTFSKTAKAILAFNPDLVLMKYWTSHLAPCLGNVAGKLKKHCPVITVLDNVTPHERRPLDNQFNAYFLKRNTAFVAMSKEVEKDLKHFVPDHPCYFKPHPIYDHFGEISSREDAIRSLGGNPELKTLLYFGFIRQYKGLDILIDAFDQLNEGYQLIIAGETYGDFSKYQRLIDKNKNRDRILVYNEYIDDSSVPDFFNGADVCVLPYRSATQSGISAIAMHFETPVISTRVGGLSEYIDHDKTGYLVDSVTPGHIADAVEKYFNSKSKGRYQEALGLAKKDLGWDAFMQEVVAFALQVKNSSTS